MPQNEVFTGKITEVIQYSARVMFGGKEGTVHASKFPDKNGPIKNLRTVCKEGDRIKVRVSPTGNNPAILECVEFPVVD